MHEYFLAQHQHDVRKNHAKFDKFDKLDDKVLKKIDAIPDETTNMKELTTLKKLEALNLDLSEKMDSLILKSFTLYQQLLSPTLHGEWNDIVQNKCFTAGQIDENNVASTENRGQDWDTLEECKRLHLLAVCEKDAAECHHLYINVTVKKPWHMTLKTYYKCLKEIITLAPMLTCLKDQSDCPSDTECINVSLITVMMCNLLMWIISPTMKDEYNGMTDVMPADPKKLIELLSKIETKLKEVKSEINPEDRQKVKGQPDDSLSNKK